MSVNHENRHSETDSAKVEDRSDTLIRVVLRQMHLLSEFGVCRVATILLSAALTGLVPVCSIYLGKLIINDIVSIVAGKPAVQANVFALLVLQCAIAVTGLGVSTVANQIKLRLGHVLRNKMTGDLHQKVGRVRFQDLEDQTTLDRLQMAISQCSKTPMEIVESLGAFVTTTTSLVTTGSLLAFMNPIVLIPAVGLALPSYFIQSRFAKRRLDVQRRQLRSSRLFSYYSFLLTTPVHAAEIRTTRFGEALSVRLMRILNLQRRQDVAIGSRQNILTSLIQAGVTAAYWSYYAFVALSVVSGRATVGDISLLLGAFALVQSGTRQLLMHAAALYSHSLFVREYYSFLGSREEQHKHKSSVTSDCDHRIQCKNVSFRYPHSSDRILRNLQFELSPGSVTALVGENGCGKTTLIKLLLGLYEDYEGEIYVGDTELRRTDLRALRSQIGVLYQPYLALQSTVRDNICLNRRVPDEQVARLINKVGLEETVGRLPIGIKTWIGSVFGDNVDFSSGQWQRIALCRAAIASPKLLVLDEPTDSLDPTWRGLYDWWHTLSGNDATVLVITHDRDELFLTDRVLVMKNGAIVQSGTARELNSRGGEFRRLFGTLS